MLITKAIILKLQLSKDNSKYITRMLGSKRVIWNESLSYKKELYETYKRRNPCVDNLVELNVIHTLGSNSSIQKAFAKKEIIKYEGYDFLLDVPSKVIQQLLNDLDSVFKDFYKRKNGYPKFKNKNDTKQSIRFLDSLGVFKINSNILGIKFGRKVLQGINPEKSNIELFNQITINNLTLSKDNMENYYASICYSFDNLKNQKIIHPKSVLGIDLGIINFLTTSDGIFHNLTKSLKNIQLKRKKLQRRYKNKNKGSISWKKLKLQIAKNYRKETNIRKDFQHKLSDKLTKTHGLIVREDLKIKNMSKSAKGTIEKPGKNVAQKSGLNREILNQGWGQFFEFLEYKSKERGVELIKVEPQGTSQICSKCEHKDPESRKGKFFKCTSCCFELDADINGAKNILTRGQRGIAERGSLTKLSPMTSELETSPLD